MTNEHELKGKLTNLLEKGEALNLYHNDYAKRAAIYILDYTMCSYPFIYINLKMISSSDRKLIAGDSTIASQIKYLIKTTAYNYKVLVNDEVVNFFVDIIPDFFDGLTLIGEDDVHKAISLDVDECLRRF